MAATTIKEFLVAIGFKVNKDDEREFEKTIGKIRTALAALGTGAAAYGAFKWLDTVTSGLEKVNFAAQRAGANVGKLQAFMYAASQTGSSKDQALSSAVAFRQWFMQPGSEALLRNNLGVNSRDTNGKLIDTTDIMERVGAALRSQIPAMQQRYGAMMHLPDELRWALQNPDTFRGFENSELAKQRRMGGNPDAIATRGQKFQQVIRDIGDTFEKVGERVAGSLTEDRGLGSAIQRFSALMEKHVPDVVHFIDVFMDAMMPFLDKFIGWLGTLDANDIKLFFEGLIALFVVLKALPLLTLAANLATLGTALTGLGSAGALSGMTALALFITSAVAGFMAVNSAIDLANGKDASNPISRNAQDTGPTAYRRTGGLMALLMSPFSKDAHNAWFGNHPIDGAARNASGDFHRERMGMSAGGAGGDRESALRNLESMFGLPPNILGAVMMQESGGKPGRTSKAGAQGYFQFMPATAKRWGVKDPNNFDQAAQGAARYLQWLLKRYHGNVDMALAGWNWGEGNLDKKGLMNMPGETRNFIPSVERMMQNPHGHRRKAKDTAAGTAGAPSVSATTTIHVNGAGDPIAVGSAVAGRQADVHQRLVRNFRQVYS